MDQWGSENELIVHLCEFSPRFIYGKGHMHSAQSVCTSVPGVKGLYALKSDHNFLGKMPKKVKNGPETGLLAFKENEFISLVWKWSKMKVFFFLWFLWFGKNCISRKIPVLKLES